VAIAAIGTGRIGQALIKKCLGLGMNVLCYDAAFQNHAFVESVQKIMDSQHNSGLYPNRTSIRYVSLEEALSQANFISLHVPLVKKDEPGEPTYHLINEQSLGMMRKDDKKPTVMGIIKQIWEMVSKMRRIYKIP